MSDIKKILVVCTGNACRSPMAEGYLRAVLKQEEGFEVMSAGTGAADGFKPTQEAVDVMKEDSVDISFLITKAISKSFVDAADLILVMAEKHKKFILEYFPESKEKVFLYKQYARIDDGSKDIADPIGQPIQVYRKIRDEIKNATNNIVKRVKGDAQ
jgi:protein-tyrosine-phosphatase